MRIVILTLFCLCAACATTTHWPAVQPKATVAVAGFVHPQYDWELMAGVLPEEKSEVSPVTVDELNQRLLAAVRNNTARSVMPAGIVRQCEEIVVATKERQRFETVEYWKSVAQCMKAEFLLVPYVSRWQDRQGGEWGVTRPAELTLDLYLIEVASGQVRRFHFEERQQGLTENLLQSKKFFQRKGKWVTALEIATEALGVGVTELGL